MTPYFYSLLEVQRKMVAAWDGVNSLSASATMIYFPSMVRSDRPRFHDKAEAGGKVFTLKAWWQHPDRWRHDTNLFIRDGACMSYVGVHDRWWVWRNEALQHSGSVTSAKEQQFTKKCSLTWGRPYLTPKENAHLWLWINPTIWVASFNMVANNRLSPLPDAVYGDHVVHLLAGPGLARCGEETPHTRQLREDWNAVDWKRGQELTDFGNVFQLWVDMRTGFCRRMTSEGFNGRQWDIIVESLEINGHEVPGEIFCGRVPEGSGGDSHCQRPL